MDQQTKQNESDQNKKQNKTAKDEWNQVLPRILEPTGGKGKPSRGSNEDGQAHEHSEDKKKLPHEVTQPSFMAASPAPPDFAALRDHAVKQDKAHHAAHVEKQYPENCCQPDQQCNQRGVQQ